MIRLRYTKFGRTSLDAWSARRRDLYVTTQHSQEKNIHGPSGFEPTIPESERPRGHRDRQESKLVTRKRYFPNYISTRIFTSSTFHSEDQISWWGRCIRC